MLNNLTLHTTVGTGLLSGFEEVFYLTAAPVTVGNSSLGL